MVAYIKFRWGHGDGDDVERLWKKLSRTYLGSCRQAFDYAVERLRKGLSTCRTKEGTLKAKAEDRRRVPRPVARLFGRDPVKLCASDREYMRKLGGLNSEVESAYELAQGFSRMLRVRRHLEMLDGWLEKASPADRPSCAALCRRCTRRQRRRSRGFSKRWNNGPIEGQIHRLKLLKRQMYGRADFDLLKRRAV